MHILPPAEVGMAADQVDTPALILDLPRFERNLERMAATVRRLGAGLRPHAKSHKCPAIARRQLELGAVGVCTQKVSEAAVMVDGGVANVLVTNEVVGDRKLDRLAALATQAWVGVCVDNADNVAAVDAAARRFGATVRVLVEIDVGAKRCGVPPGQPALDLARAVAEMRNLSFAGLQAYQGRAQHIRDAGERHDAARQAAAVTAETVALLERNGLPCTIVGGGGTGTYEVEAGSGVYNEVQAGSYIFMDADYGRNLGPDGEPVRDFEQSLFILSTVMSRPTAERVIVDAGLKAYSVDSGMPLIHGMSGQSVQRASDEHGVFDLQPGMPNFRCGAKVRLVPGHCDPTVNLHEWIVGIREGIVECIWPVAARGAVF